MWQVITTDEFDTWFTSLSEDEHVEIAAKILLLEALGPALRRLRADTLKGSRFPNMKELRASTATQVIRIAFAFDPERQAILLIGGSKTGISQKRFYRQLIAKADELYQKHLRKRRT